MDLTPERVADYARRDSRALMKVENEDLIEELRVRLTELASRAQLSLAATSELVNELESLGYLTRRPDPADGRAKLIDLTDRGRGLLGAAGDRVADIERRWSEVAGDADFATMCATMQHLLDELDPEQARS